MNYKYLSIGIRHLGEMVVTPRFYFDLVNWPEFFVDYLGLHKNKLMNILFQDGTKLTIRTNSDDKWPIHEVIIRDDYRLHKLKPDLRTIIDLGGNIGDFAVQAARLNPNARVISLEPDKRNYELLIKNINQNKCRRQITPMKLACANKRGKIAFYISNNHGGHSLLKGKSHRQINVQAVTLADVMKKAKFKQCDLLKLDIEGAEYEILYNLTQSYFKKFTYISMEYHNRDKQRMNGRYLSEFLRKQGYVVEHADSFNRTVGQLFAKRKSIN